MTITNGILLKRAQAPCTTWSKKYFSRWGRLLLVIGACQISLVQESASHARLLSPAPRTASDAIKVGPCGGIARTSTPTTWTAGSQVSVEWEETVEHPGRYFLSLSFADDKDFERTPFHRDLPDIRNAATLPHKYAYSITVPNQVCDKCTLQLIQSMEENESAPTYYYSCADIKIVAATTPGQPTPTPTPVPPVKTPDTGVSPNSGGEGKFGSTPSSSANSSSSGVAPKPGMGGCATVSALQERLTPQGTSRWLSAVLFLLGFLPLILPVLLVRLLRTKGHRSQTC